MSIIIDFSIFPMDKGDQSLSPYVARALDVIKQSGLPYQLGPMGTSIEGEWEEVMAVVAACFQELKQDSDRVFLSFNADYKKGRNNGLTNKVQSVQEKLR
ncbi:MTH1187 family thiamine-binding protein [uncultured Pseudodesulfovibrio sp.]|uniref:MTH1187 family thiamine-binding protein n=1 Tax=uncultured Pseudodesulfovibrio sp. TaxID=2035858 RepID=UPI0029C7F392|nr:MTH1187 family thiamine-binding protein [uncultured Pseudodesulfovibrio sp.]